ncbi:P-loop containing nucleoside triphosphate hydrolase protein, partial [Mycena leptocephala]
PKIFHGRDSELKDLIDILLCDPARVAILGAGGMGKTTLASASLHHPAIMEKYPIMHFISCEWASSCADLVTSIGLHLGLQLSSQFSKAIVRHFDQCGPCLMVLDNFETPWESMESRKQVEEFLSLLAGIPRLALLVTMRGAERPGRVKWNRPFLPPLEPLSPSASRRIFIEVADEPGSGEELALDDLLDLSGSCPLAVSLLANIASFEGYSSTLVRWQTENTALLSEGHDKRSNLEKSITHSVNSPRISSSPDARSLVSLLSLLPDGIRAEDIIAAKVLIPNVRQCQSVLIGTSMAYIDVKGRLKTLTPVREYIRRAYPPSKSMCRPLRTYFQDLLELWRSNSQLPSGNLAPELVSHLGNINELI